MLNDQPRGRIPASRQLEKPVTPDDPPEPRQSLFDQQRSPVPVLTQKRRRRQVAKDRHGLAAAIA
jgi:hypothetical protein